MHIAVLVLSILVVLAVQLLLCFKTKRMKIVPLVLFGVLTAFSVVMSLITENWTSFGYVVLAVFFSCLVFACGLGFLICRFIKK